MTVVLTLGWVRCQSVPDGQTAKRCASAQLRHLLAGGPACQLDCALFQLGPPCCWPMLMLMVESSPTTGDQSTCTSTSRAVTARFPVGSQSDPR